MMDAVAEVHLWGRGCCCGRMLVADGQPRWTCVNGCVSGSLCWVAVGPVRWSDGHVVMEGGVQVMEAIDWLLALCLAKEVDMPAREECALQAEAGTEKLR